MLIGTASGAGVIAAISASSSSNDRWQRRQRLLDVRNCTRRQWSQRTTSRESTGVNVVAMQVLRVPERGYSQSQLACNLLHWACESQDKSRRKQSIYRIEAESRGKNRQKTGTNHESTGYGMVFTN